MKRYYFKEKTPLKYHKFLWYVSLPLSMLINIVGFILICFTTEILNWGHAVDLAFYFIEFVLVVTAFVGFFKWSPSSWYAVMGIQWCTIAYYVFLLLLAVLFNPDDIDSSLGTLIGGGVVSILIMVYYRKRRPLFFRDMVPADCMPEQVPPTEKPCPQCGHVISAEAAYCNHCGYTPQIKPAQEIPKIRFCRGCGTKLLDGSTFCHKCGTAVVVQAQSAEQKSCDAQTEDKTVLTAEPMAAQGNICQVCGRKIPEYSKGCLFCGPGVVQNQSAEKKAAAAAPRRKQKKWIVLSVFAALIAAAIALCAILPGREEAQKEPSSEVPEPAATETVAPNETTSLSEAAASVLYLEVFDENDTCIGTASGFLAVSDRTLITNYHVVEDAHRIVAWTSDAERSVEANTLLAYDEVADLAVLRCDSTLWVEPLVFANSDETKQGETVYAVGYPLGIANTMSNGIVSARYIDEYGVDTIQMTAAISEGNSGGPLINQDGEVIGVVCAYYIYGQNMNMAVASNTLKELLDKKSEPILLEDWVDRPAMPGYEEIEEQKPEVTPTHTPTPTPTPTPTTINRIDKVEAVVGDSCNGYSTSDAKVLNGTLTYAVISGTEVELSYDIDNLVPADKEYLVDEVMDQILNYVIDDINEAGFPEVINVYITANYDVSEEPGPSKQAVAYSALYDWVAENYNETWNDGSISYWWWNSQDDWRYDYDIMIDEGDLVLRCEATDPDSRDVVYVTLRPEGTASLINYFRYESVDAETATVVGSGYIDASVFTEDSIIRFTSVEGPTAGIEYLEEIATILCALSLKFCDNILHVGTTYTIADLGFTSFS